MSHSRAVLETLVATPVVEGAGVRLNRAFGYHQVPRLDPFLMLDDFRSTNPDDYRAGFPWHPHRGIETITYVLYGQVEHGDSMGNKGVIGAGDVQWMTAGSGIVHQEMPKGEKSGRMGGFQLWANLPAVNKMMNPRYREIKADAIPVVTLENGVKIRVICGRVNQIQGPVRDIVTDPEYLDVSLPAKARFTHDRPLGHTVFAYVFEGEAVFGPSGKGRATAAGRLALFGEGTSVEAEAGNPGCRFLLISGKPIREPVAWGGPIVMNTQEELDFAFREYQEGTFLKHAR